MKFAVIFLVVCIAFVSSARINLNVEIDDGHFSKAAGCVLAACNKLCMEDKTQGVCINGKCQCMDKREFKFEYLR